MRLKGKTVFITGGARGIGRACAIEFAKQGADLILTDLCRKDPAIPYSPGSESQLELTASYCREHNSNVLTITMDIRSSEDIKEAVIQAIKRFGKIDVLLNNAGIVSPSGKFLHETKEDEWLTMIDINLSGAWRTMKEIVPYMTSQKSGSIINISSTAGLVGYRYFSGYVASKHGIIGLTKAAALDYAPLKIRVNAICPGSVRDSHSMEGVMLSEISRSLNIAEADTEDIFLQSQPMNSLIEPEDIANAALWLASDESKQVTGSVTVVDGGYTIR